MWEVGSYRIVWTISLYESPMWKSIKTFQANRKILVLVFPIGAEGSRIMQCCVS